MQLGRLAEAREALTESLRLARRDSAVYEVGLALDALVALGRLDGGSETAVERERDSIFRGLGVVATPKVPLPLDVKELSATP
jgi:hypothetical protein